MKKQYTAIVSLAVILIFIALSCSKKNSSGISPGYKADNGTGGNPNANNPTVTGATTNTNLATENTNITVGGSGWSNPSCGSSNSLTLQGINGNNIVTLSFATAPTSNTYNIGSTPSGTTCSMMIVNAPNQPAGIVWYGKTGQVLVNVTPNSINATFSGILCVQQNFNYPFVTASGVLGCSQ